MDKFPVLWNGSAVGELCIEQAGGCAVFSVCCRLPTTGLWSVWLVGACSELRLGVMESSGLLRRQFSSRLTTPLGPLERGELRRVGTVPASKWERVTNSGELFQTPWIRQQLDDTRGALFHRECRQLALPYEPCRPFPLPPLFCFARVCTMDGKQYVVYRFDEEEKPRFP